MTEPATAPTSTGSTAGRWAPGGGPAMRVTRAELAHWRAAVSGLADLDAVAAPAAWSMLESYLQLRVRDRLLRSVAELAAEGGTIAAALEAGEPLETVRRRVLRLRQRYLEL